MRFMTSIMLLLFVSSTYLIDIISADEKKFEECRQKLIKAKELDVLYDLDWKLPNEPKVIVGPTFFNLPFDAKENFVFTVNCFLMAGDEDKFVDFNLLDWKSNKRVGRFSRGKFKMD